MSDKKDIFKLTPLGEEQITAQNIAPGDLWMLRDEDQQIHGPYDTNSLKDYASNHAEELKNILAYNLEQEQWQPFYKITKFQRRKPKLVPMQSLMTSDNFLILFNGEKKGPFTLDQVQQFVDQKKIALNVQVSLDNGESWIKLYEHHAFDRRLKKNAEDLPFVPEPDLFEGQEQIIRLKAEQHTKSNEEEDALVGLAFLSNGNDKGQVYKEEKHNSQKDRAQAKKKVQFRQLNSVENRWKNFFQKLNFKYVSAGVLGVFLLFTAFNSMNSSYDGDSDIVKAAHQKESKTRPASINNSNRVKQKELPVNKKPARIVRAKKYQPKVQKRQLPTSRRPAKIRKRQVHRDSRYEALDIDDPAVKEELSRELAGDTYGDEYQEDLDQDQKDFIEKANQEGFSEGDYEEMEQRDELYDTVEDFQ